LRLFQPRHLRKQPHIRYAATSGVTTNPVSTTPGQGPIYFASLVDPDDGQFLADDQLREILGASGIGDQGKIITYCGGGIGATMTGFALKLCGREDIAVYDASMMEWNADPSLPITDPSSDRAVASE
ncbi:rhodanese-like domain-containing protein, partial [Mycobacterium sp. CVI_P3]|nr:rhodanese-like domain-containing protein [Mycobacterium pinniadriaticum]MCX2941146.1 rhodanese-like domain-containing protein [Mycobacterium pinniadriaticum]